MWASTTGIRIAVSSKPVVLATAQTKTRLYEYMLSPVWLYTFSSLETRFVRVREQTPPAVDKHFTLTHGVRHGQKSGRANTEYIVYKNYNSL